MCKPKPYRYRVVESDDYQDKGQLGGHCNTKSCQKPYAFWYNTGTDSYYCGKCANDINKINRDLGKLICVPPGHEDYVIEFKEKK